MAIAERVATQTQDLHSFLDEYEHQYPDEVMHIEQPLSAAWEITALAAKLEKAKRFPILICHNVMIDGERAELPLITFTMASRLRMARLLGVDIRNAGLATYERVQNRIKPV